MAQFVNQSTNMKFQLTVNDEAKTVTVSKISNSASADKLSSVAGKFAKLFTVTPTSVHRTANDLIEAE